MYVVYLRNIGPFSLWTLSFEPLILAASFHSSFTFATWFMNSTLGRRCSFNDVGLPHNLETFISKVNGQLGHLCFPFSVFLEEKSCSQPYNNLDLPLTWSCPQVFLSCSVCFEFSQGWYYVEECLVINKGVAFTKRFLEFQTNF